MYLGLVLSGGPHIVPYTFLGEDDFIISQIIAALLTESE
jgi:hypothetical protein